MLLKTCPKCGQTKAVDEFYKSTKSSDGLQGYCIECTRIRDAARYQERVNANKKACACCGDKLPLSEFSRTRSGSTHSWCKSCLGKANVGHARRWQSRDVAQESQVFDTIKSVARSSTRTHKAVSAALVKSVMLANYDMDGDRVDRVIENLTKQGRIHAPTGSTVAIAWQNTGETLRTILAKA